MPKSRELEDRGEQIIAVRFRVRAPADEVVAGLLESVRPTDLSLYRAFGDGNRIYPLEGGKPGRIASSWRVELVWSSPTAKPAWHLQMFLARVGLFLNVPEQVRLELGGSPLTPEMEALA